MKLHLFSGCVQLESVIFKPIFISRTFFSENNKINAEVVQSQYFFLSDGVIEYDYFHPEKSLSEIFKCIYTR